MKLEEATKEELIWWIRQHTFEISHALRHFESEILFRRYKDYNAKAEIAGNSMKRHSMRIRRCWSLMLENLSVTSLSISFIRQQSWRMR